MSRKFYCTNNYNENYNFFNISSYFRKSQTLTAQFKNIRPAYGFDEVSIVPGKITVNPELVNTDFSIGDINISVPIIASAIMCPLLLKDRWFGATTPIIAMFISDMIHFNTY